MPPTSHSCPLPGDSPVRQARTSQPVECELLALSVVREEFLTVASAADTDVHWLRDSCVRVSHIDCATGGINPRVFSVFPRAPYVAPILR